MRFVILHYHIFKNAGSTMEDILDHSFGDRFGMLETPANQGVIPNQELLQYLDARPGVVAFSSHQIRYPMPEAPGYLFFDICFLREPLDRLRSFYDYFRQRPNPADPMSDLANRSSLGEFVAEMIRDHSLFVRDNQVNLMACGGDSDEPGERDLELAIRRARAASFLGVVDCFEQSVVAGAEALRQAFPELDCVRPAVNVSRGMNGTVEDRVAELKSACDPAVYAELLRITALDRRLVDAARAEVLRRSGQIRPRLARIPAPNVVPNAAPARGVPRVSVRMIPYWRQLLMKEVWQPHPLFDPAWYLSRYPDVDAAGVDPFLHYLKHGWVEGRQPHPLFDTSFYLDRNPDVRQAGVNPLVHYLRHGAAEDRKPHPLFDPKYYRASCGQVLAAGVNPLLHFLEAGAAAASPHPLFDCSAYLDSRPEVAELGVNPLVHYLTDVRTPQVVAMIEIRDVRIGGIAESQQLPFLRALSADQLRAQSSR